MKMDISQQPCSIRGREQTILKAASIWKVPCSLLDILRTFTWTRRSSTLIFSFWVNLQNKIFGEKVFCTDVENITQDNCFFLATSAIPFFIAELAGNAKKYSFRTSQLQQNASDCEKKIFHFHFLFFLIHKVLTLLNWRPWNGFQIIYNKTPFSKRDG